MKENTMKNHDKIATRLALILSKFNSGEKFSIDDLVEEFNVTKELSKEIYLKDFHIYQLKKRIIFIILKSII